MTEEQMKKAISEIENAMERWHLGRDNDDETLAEINRILLELGLLTWHNQENNG